MSANGLIYTAKLQSVTVTNAVQNLFEIIAGVSTSLLLHSIRLEFVPLIVSGVAQDARGSIIIQSLSTTGTGGTAVIPAAEHPRNTTSALTTINALVTAPGTASIVRSASSPSIGVPFERAFTAEQRIPITGGGRLAISLIAPLGGTYVMSAEIYFEEF